MAHKLTKRQLLTLELIAHGFTNSEIAVIARVSVRTVESNRKRIVEKLKVTNAVEAVSLAISKGVLRYNPDQFNSLRFQNSIN